MKIVKIGETYLNLENVTHAEFETSPHGLVCTVFFNCQTTDRNGSNGVQASKTFTAGAARDLKAWLELRLKTMEPEKM
jgi:hypothetical protein